MQARIKNPAFLVPDALASLQALGKVVGAAVPARLNELLHVRASQLNGCAVCLEGHRRHALRHGETDERLFAVAAWQDSPLFTPAERAALALTEAVTRLPVPDEVWEEAARHFDEAQLAALVLSIATINVWNRLNVATRQIAGATTW